MKMQTFEIDDQEVARRCRRAQFAGREVTLVLNGCNIYGRVSSVMGTPADGPKTWTIKIEPLPLRSVSPKTQPKRSYFRV